jgi:hypothetical protein
MQTFTKALFVPALGFFTRVKRFIGTPVYVCPGQANLSADFGASER